MRDSGSALRKIQKRSTATVTACRLLFAGAAAGVSQVCRCAGAQTCRRVQGEPEAGLGLWVSTYRWAGQRAFANARDAELVGSEQEETRKPLLRLRGSRGPQVIHSTVPLCPVVIYTARRRVDWHSPQ